MRWRKQRERDLQRELRSDLEAEIAEHRKRGLSDQDAVYAAQRSFGNAALVSEGVREAWGWTFTDAVLQDFRYAFRVLSKSPAFTAVAVFSLAIGSGANTGVFSLLDSVLLKYLPVRHPEELRILTWMKRAGDVRMRDHSGYRMLDEHGRNVDESFSWPAYQLFRTAVPQFSDLVAFAPDEFTITANGTSDVAFGNYVSGNYFTGLGAQTIMGRTIIADDDGPGKPPVAVLTNAYWTSRFGRDPGVIERGILIDGKPLTVIGVLPGTFGQGFTC